MQVNMLEKTDLIIWRFMNSSDEILAAYQEINCSNYCRQIV